MPTVDVVVPVFNEQSALPQTIPTLRDFLLSDAFPYEWRIVIADNASIDDTPAVGSALMEKFPGEVKYVRIERKGRGFALKKTWSESDADVRSYMDVDLSTGLGAFPRLINAIAEDGYDVAIGSRLARKSKTTRSLQRTALSVGYNAIIKATFWTRFSDAQCGFKAISREVAETVLPLIEDNNWFFDTELLILSEKMGYRVKDVPVRWVEDPDTRVKIGATVTEDLRGLWRMRTGTTLAARLTGARCNDATAASVIFLQAVIMSSLRLSGSLTTYNCGTSMSGTMQPDLATTSTESGMAEWARRLAYRLHLPTTMLKFLIVGGIGFLINQFFLFILYDTTIFGFLPEKGASETLFFFTHTDTRLLISSIIAVEIAILAQFNLHDRWTFRHREREGNVIIRFLKFNLSSAVSPIIIVVTVNLLTPVLRDGPNDSSTIGTLAPYIATTVGVLLGFIWNWTFTSVIIWPTRRGEREADYTAQDAETS